MFDTLARGFRNARLKLQGRTELSEDAVADALRDVRVSLLEADVALDVTKDFLERVKARSLGQVVTLKSKQGMVVTAADHFIKSCYDEMVEMMGGDAPPLELPGKPAVIMMVGLQGSGKTTTAGKLARRLQAEGRKPMLVAADIYRPAAVEQLTTLGRKLNVPVFSIKGMNPVQLCGLAVTQARNVGRDVVILDTAGRLAIDEPLMQELEQIREKTHPDQILFVCDAMIGQDAVRTAGEFDRRLAFTGFVLTKLDGDARGGAALSIKKVTGKPVRFVGMGEGLEKLEDFRAEGLAQRILGYGDVVGLMKDFERVVDKEKAEKDANRMLQGDFTFDDFKEQLKMIRSMGSLKEVMGKLPMMDELMSQVPEEALDDYEMVRVESMIDSMTRAERQHPDVIDSSRAMRIARGSGRQESEVHELLQRFKMTREMMKNMGALTQMLQNPKQARRLQQQLAQMGAGGGFGGMGGMGAEAAKIGLDKATLDARRRKAKDARKARKKQRR